MWSLFNKCSCAGGEEFETCECSFHPEDNHNVLGDQDDANFQFMHMVLAKLMEGRPLGMCVYPFSARGRNGKGLLEKMIMKLWGSYYVPVKPTVFCADTRNEN